MAGAFVAGLLALAPETLTPGKLAAVVFSCTAVYLSSRAHIRLAQTVRQLRERAQAADRPGSAAA